MLDKLNPHPRDELLSFDEPSHTYTVNGEGGYMSATTFVHSNFPAFDEDAIINKMMNSPNWPRNKYYPMTKDEIKAQWETTRNEAADSGTKMHAQIEDYYNSLPVSFDSIEMRSFQQFHQDYAISQGLKAYRTEWRIFHEELKIAGTIDMTYVDENGNIYIVDWKRCREIKKHINEKWPPEHSLNPGLSNFYDTNYYHYSLQLNLYKHILETKYKKVVKELALVNLHPEKRSSVGQTYEYFDVPFMSNEEIQSLYRWRVEISDK